jgi:preprotein translocase subunit YajC
VAKNIAQSPDFGSMAEDRAEIGTTSVPFLILSVFFFFFFFRSSRAKQIAFAETLDFDFTAA